MENLNAAISGFAARCEAGLCPAVSFEDLVWAGPLVRALP